jgi:hypothetical protein
MILAVALNVTALVAPALAQMARLGPTFTANRLSNGRTTPVRYTDVAWDPANRVYLYIWGAFGEILGRWVTVDGQVLGDNPFVVAVPLHANDYKDAPKIAYSPDSGAFMVVWRDNRNHVLLPQIWGRSLRYGGGSGDPQFLTGDFPITNNFVSVADSAAIAYSTASREFLVTYQRDYDIRGRRYDINGNLLGSEIQIGASGDYEFQPTVTYNPNANEFFVAWKWYSDALFGGTIQGRRVRAGADATIGGTIDMDGVTGGDLAVPTVAFDPVGNHYLLAWHRVVEGFQTVGRLLNADGSHASGRFTLAPTGNYVELDVEFNTQANSFFTVFAHHDILDIYGVRVSAAGNPDAMMQVTVTASATGTDYGRIAAAHDRPDWLVTNNIWWDKATAQRITFGGGGGTPPPLAALSKLSPGNGSSSTNSPTLSWNGVGGAASYEVCIDTANNDGCDASWSSAGNGTAFGTNLPPGTYFWQVRAQTPGGVVVADSGAWWSFTVAVAAPLFSKTAPANGAGNQSASVTLSWTGVANSGYTVCWDTANNNSCDTGWWPNGPQTSRNLSDLAPGTYYWQVRAHTGAGVTEANSGSWNSFTVGGAPTPPPTQPPPTTGAAFAKQTPSGGGSSRTLTWSALPDAGYWVCWDTTNNNSCDSGWWPNGGGNGRNLTDLADGTYYWQVRAQTSAGIVEADAGNWGSFAVGNAPPPPTNPAPQPPPTGGGGSFAKASPANGTAGLPSSITLTWAAVADAGYTVCWDTTNNNSCDTSWWPNGGGSSRNLTGLADGTYYWQVRSHTGAGIAEANSGVWASFTVGNAVPAASKQAPINGVSGLGSNVTLQWSPVAGVGYLVCWDTSNNNSCDTAWWPNGGGNSRNVTDLAPGTYYWQVRTTAAGGNVEGDGGVWWTFTVGAAASGSFGKAAPGSGSSGFGSTVNLQWTAVADVGYLVCWDTSNNNSCDNAWWPNGGGNARQLTGLAPGTYYWQVRAQSPAGTFEADNGVWWSFTVTGELEFSSNDLPVQVQASVSVQATDRNGNAMHWPEPAEPRYVAYYRGKRTDI